jgi:hypothetical protein
MGNKSLVCSKKGFGDGLVCLMPQPSIRIFERDLLLLKRRGILSREESHGLERIGGYFLIGFCGGVLPF